MTYFLSQDGSLQVSLNIEYEADGLGKFNDKNTQMTADVKGYYDAYYVINKNLSSEDASQAEKNLSEAIKSGDTSFRVPTFARVDQKPSMYVSFGYIGVPDIGRIDDETTNEIIEDIMTGSGDKLSDFPFLEPLAMPAKDLRIEYICKVPEELQVNQAAELEFNAENWMSYYNAQLDEAHLNNSIEDSCEGFPNASISVSGDKITTYVESDFALDLPLLLEDAETGEEIETEAYVVASFEYTVDYKIDELSDYRIERIQEALDRAIEAGQSTFKAPIPIVVVDVRNAELTDLEQYMPEDDDILERIEDDDAIFDAVQKSLTKELSVWKDARHTGDFIQPPSNKTACFICTIPIS